MGDAARLGVFLSGGGRTLKNIVARIGDGSLLAEVALVVASRECGGALWAREQGFATEVIEGEIPKGALGALLAEHGVGTVVLAGYNRLLPVPPGYAGRVVNIHPSLLPSFGGQGMYGDRVHRAVIESGCRVSGCTVHFCDDEYDRGPIISQLTCPVHDTDTPETLAARVFELETRAYPEALRRVVLGELRIDGRRVVSSGRCSS